MIGKYGLQPVRVELYRRKLSVRKAAEQIGVSQKHLTNVLYGRTHPMDVVREKMPELLGSPLDELFTADLLAKPYDSRFCTQPGAKR